MKIAGYEIQREIGRSAYAAVFLALQTASGRQVALKVFSPALAADTEFAESFRLEMNSAAKVRHRGINPILECGNVDSVFYIASEYAEKGNLRQRIATGIDVSQVISVTQQIAEAVAELHHHDFVHGNIKPENILFDNDGKVKLADLGVAQLLDGNSALAAMGVSLSADAFYICPEDLNGDELDFRSDQYALGCLLFHALSGKAPYANDDRLQMAWLHYQAPIPQLSGDQAFLQPLLDRLMAKENTQRYAATDDIVGALEEIRGAYARGDHGVVTTGKTIASRPAAGNRRASRNRPRRSTMRALGITTLVLLGFGTVIAGSYVWNERETLLKDLLSSPLANKKPENANSQQPKHVIDQNTLTTPADLVVASTPASPDPDLPGATSPTLTQGSETSSETDTVQTTAAPEAQADTTLGDLPKLSLISVNRRNDSTVQDTYPVNADNQSTQSQLKTPPDPTLSDNGNGLSTQDQATTPDATALNTDQDGLPETGAPVTLEQEIDQLLVQGGRQLGQLRLTTPPGDNAYETYNQVLILDPYNAEARLGNARIVATYVSLARRKLDQGLYREGLRRINSGLRIDPDHKQLLALKTAVERELALYNNQPSGGGASTPPKQVSGDQNNQGQSDSTFSRLLSRPVNREPPDYR